MLIKTKHTALEISVLFAFCMALVLIKDSNGIAVFTIAACALHECGHLVCLALMDDYPYRITLSFFGIRIERQSGCGISKREDSLVALCGPAVNIILFAVLAAFRSLREFALINLLIGVFNLLPCFPLDGGRILRNIASEKISRAVSVITLAVMAVCSAALAVHSKNITMLVVTLYLAAAKKDDK